MTTSAPQDLAYGSDLSTFVDGVADLDPTFAIITGPRVVAEALARRFMQEAGTLEDDPRYGYDLRQETGARLTAVRRVRIAAKIVAQCQEDPRVLSATVAELTSDTPGRFRVSVKVTLASGPFDLVLSVSAVTVEILKVARG